MTIYDFILEEYKANWDYLKHIEVIRLRLYQLYVTITAALLSVLAGLYKFSDGDMNLVGESAAYFSGFLAIYGFLFIWLMFNQKISYEKYRAKNIAIRRVLYEGKEGLFPDELSESVKSIEPKEGSFMRSSFIAWLSLPLSISIAAVIVFVRSFFA